MYQDSGLIKFRRLPEVPKAVCLKHVGTYNTFPESFAMVMRYIETHGYRVAGKYRILLCEGRAQVFASRRRGYCNFLIVRVPTFGTHTTKLWY